MEWSGLAGRWNQHLLISSFNLACFSRQKPEGEGEGEEEEGGEEGEQEVKVSSELRVYALSRRTAVSPVSMLCRLQVDMDEDTEYEEEEEIPEGEDGQSRLCSGD